MTDTTSEPLPLFKHTARKDWGVGVLVREDEGKRAYLFEDGQERTMANGFHQLMRRVEEPSPSQRAFYERQRGMLAAREKNNASASTRTEGPSFHEQVEKLHKAYPAGLADPKWMTEIRGEGVDARTPRHRDALIREAQERLSASALDALLKTQSYAQVWEAVTSVLSHSDLVPAAQLKKPKSAGNDTLRALALAVRELLHGTAAYEPRFDAWVAALTLFANEARWELATALPAAFHPTQYICVHPTSFRRQLKLMGARGAAPARATSAGYTRFSTIARLVSNKLTEYGTPPRDLFDVYDFVRITLGPAARVRA